MVLRVVVVSYMVILAARMVVVVVVVRVSACFTTATLQMAQEHLQALSSNDTSTPCSASFSITQEEPVQMWVLEEDFVIVTAWNGTIQGHDPC